jgi:DNA-directed RNA polymerase subunit F
MAAPEFIEEKPLALAEVKEVMEKIAKRDEELNYRSNKAKEFLDNFANIDKKTQKEIQKKLMDLKLTRLKEEHIAKIVDFLPKDVEELKIVLQAYPLSMPKKDQDAIVKVTKEYA